MRAEGIDVISLGHRRSRPADAAGRRRRLSQRAVERPETHQYPSNRGLPGLSRGRRGLLRRPLRGRARSGIGGDPGARRQGGRRPRRARLPRPGRRLPRARSRLPAVHVGPGVRGRRRPLPAARRGERVHARPGRRFRRRLAAQANLLYFNYPNNPTGAVVADGFFERAVGVRPRARARRDPRLRLHRDRLRRLPAAELPRDPGSEGGRASRSSPSPRAGT